MPKTKGASSKKPRSGKMVSVLNEKTVGIDSLRVSLTVEACVKFNKAVMTVDVTKSNVLMPKSFTKEDVAESVHEFVESLEDVYLEVAERSLGVAIPVAKKAAAIGRTIKT